MIWRVLVAEPPAPSGAPSAASALAALARSAPLETARAIETAATLAECIDRCRRGAVDLVVVDEALGRDAEEIVARLRCSGPALIVLQRSASDAAALAWFRRGASDCVMSDRDYTALRHAAREQLERLRSARRAGPERAEAAAAGILNRLGSALVLIDAAGRITFANAAAERILGCAHADLRGRPFRAFLGESGGDAPLAAAFERGDGTPGAEARISRGDGSSVPIALSWGPIPGDDGRPIGAVAVFQDLSHAQEWRAQALQTEKMASIGQLAAGVAHEINNPMGFIHANLFQMAEYVGDLRQAWSRVESLMKAIESGEAEPIARAGAELAETAGELDVNFVLQDLAKAIRESQEGSERIRHIVQDLREFSHQDNGERVLADLNQCLDSTANIVWPMMKHLVVLSKHYAELPPVPCYPMQLKQVFMNLLVNAYQAIEEALKGGGREAEMGTVTLTTAARDGGVVVEISDTGVGIDPEHLDRIFDPFFTTKQVGAGTGLGLSTSFHIVRRHGGTLGVESRRGRGTTFRIHLPLLREGPDGAGA